MKVCEQKNEATKQVTTAIVGQIPTEGQWFEVNPQTINQKLFQKTREELMQEKTRHLILEAFANVTINPEKYGRIFYTMMPKKTWSSKTVAELKEMACELGDHNADWIEQALEWAQRIANGESWEVVCNYADTANWYRLVVWKYGYARCVGGSVDYGDGSPASFVYDNDYRDYTNRRHTVPLVVLYK